MKSGSGWCENRLGWRLLKELAMKRIRNKTFVPGKMKTWRRIREYLLHPPGCGDVSPKKGTKMTPRLLGWLTVELLEGL